VKGLVARGAFEVEMFWKDGKLTQAFITSKVGNPLKLRTNEKIEVRNIKSQISSTKLYNKTQYLTSFETKAGQVYELIVRN
jgi:alpha-L-fucosidase 2